MWSYHATSLVDHNSVVLTVNTIIIRQQKTSGVQNHLTALHNDQETWVDNSELQASINDNNKGYLIMEFGIIMNPDLDQL